MNENSASRYCLWIEFILFSLTECICFGIAKKNVCKFVAFSFMRRKLRNSDTLNWLQFRLSAGQISYRKSQLIIRQTFTTQTQSRSK